MVAIFMMILLLDFREIAKELFAARFLLSESLIVL